jgi:hypothetical protein
MQLYKRKVEHARGEDHLPSSPKNSDSSFSKSYLDPDQRALHLKQARYLRAHKKAYNKQKSTPNRSKSYKHTAKRNVLA